jgi:hypothetical protein
MANISAGKAGIVGATAALLAVLMTGIFVLTNGGSQEPPPRSATITSSAAIRRKLVLPSGYYIDFDSGGIDRTRNDSKDLHNNAQVIEAVEIDQDVRLSVLDPKVASGAQDTVIQTNCAESTLFTSSYRAIAVDDQLCMRTSQGRLVFLQVVATREKEPRAITFNMIMW